MPCRRGEGIRALSTAFISRLFGGVFGASICFVLSPQIARLTTIPYVLLAPFMIGIIFFAAFQATRNWGDLLALCARVGSLFGVAGLIFLFLWRKGDVAIWKALFGAAAFVAFLGALSDRLTHRCPHGLSRTQLGVQLPWPLQGKTLW